MKSMFAAPAWRMAGVTALLLALLMATSGAVIAASELRGIMKTWRSDERATRAMLSGRAAMDEAAIRKMLELYVNGAVQIGATIKETSNDARDLKRRFVVFQADAASALGKLGQPAALKDGLHQVMSNCQSCHDLYKD